HPRRRGHPHLRRRPRGGPRVAARHRRARRAPAHERPLARGARRRAGGEPPGLRAEQRSRRRLARRFVASPGVIDDLIRTRRTHKAFGPDPVPRDVLLELFELARWAPNHHVTDPWRFRVLGPAAREGLKAAAEAYKAGS